MVLKLVRAESAQERSLHDEQRAPGGKSAMTENESHHSKRSVRKTRNGKKSKGKRSVSTKSSQSLSRSVGKKLNKRRETKKKGKRASKNKNIDNVVKSKERKIPKGSAKGRSRHRKRSRSKNSRGSRTTSRLGFVPAKAKTRLGDSEKFTIDELNWSTFDVIVSLQLVGAGIFLLLAFIAGIVGIESFWSPMLMSLLLFVCSLPGFWCIVRNKIQDGILAFSLTQISSGFCGLFWGTVTLLDFSQGDRREDWRSVAIMVVALWQFFTVIAVNSLPYRKVSLVDVVKRLKKSKKQKQSGLSAADESATEDIPSLVAQNSQIVINMDDESRRHRSQSSTQKRLASFLKFAKERKERDQMTRMQRVTASKQTVFQSSGKLDNEMIPFKERSVKIAMQSPSTDSLSTAHGTVDTAEARVSPVTLIGNSHFSSTCPTQVSSNGLRTDITASSKSSNSVQQKVKPTAMKPSVYFDSSLN